MTITDLPHETIQAVNFGERVGVPGPDLLLMHYTGVPSAEIAIELLTTGKREVSCHYLVRQDGGIVNMVDEDMRAWHAGKAVWEGCSDINSRSIGIEICNPGHGDNYTDFPAMQIDAVTRLAADIVERHTIDPHHVLGHSDVSPGRKIDPGEKFPWQALANRGVGLWVEPAPVVKGPVLEPGASGDEVATLQRDLASYGYGIDVTGVYDAHTEAVVKSFQMHFRPARCDGAADVSTCVTLSALLSAHANQCA